MSPAAIFAVNLERMESFSTEDVSPLPEGKFVKHMYDLDNVPDNLYNNVLDELYDLDNVLDKLYDLDNALDKLYDL